MLRIRNKDGSLTELPKGAFLEMLNDHDQKLGSVFYEAGPAVIRIKPGSVDAARYEQLFGDVQFLPTELKLQP